jgi:hypothetical protein
MVDDHILLILIAIAMGIIFFVADYYGGKKKEVTIPVSIIAGISVTYFFLVVLPEISERLPEYPLHLTLFEYFFVLIGFVFIHISEKLIVQRVEAKTQEKIRKLLRMEKDLELVEDHIEDILDEELSHEKLDSDALRDLAGVATNLHIKGKTIKNQILESKKRIHDHMNEEFEDLRFFTNFFYHFLIGIILINLILIELLPAILFFVFAFFRLIISKRSLKTYKIFTDIDIKIDYEETKIKRLLLGGAALMGMAFDLILDIFYPVNLEILYILFSFVSGVILYTIVREVIPEKEKGNPLAFLLSVVGFTIIVIILNIFVSLL